MRQHYFNVWRNSVETAFKLPNSRLHKIEWCTPCSLASWAGHMTLSTSRDSSVVPFSSSPAFVICSVGADTVVQR